MFQPPRPRANIVCCTGPHEHRQLRAWFLSAEAQTFCDLIGCRLDPAQIFASTIKHHGGGKSVSHEMEMEDYMVDLRRKVAIVEEQNQALREQNSRLTLALDEALAIARRYRGGNQEEEDTLSNNLAGEMLVGRVGFGESFQACSASNSAIDAMAVSIVRLYRESDELRASLAMVEAERDLLRVQVQAGEQLGLALVKTIDELKTEKAELTVKLVNLEGRSRRATLDEIAESVREKYDPEYEREGMDNE
jgi:hypothetical protein